MPVSEREDRNRDNTSYVLNQSSPKSDQFKFPLHTRN